METSLTVDNVRVVVEWDREDFDGRQVYRSTLYVDGEEAYTSVDLRSGVGFRPETTEMMASLGSFLGAWCEAHEYGIPTYGESENADLFPVELWDKADWRNIADEIYYTYGMDD